MTNKIISMLLLCGMSFAESSAQNPVNNFKVDVKVTQRDRNSLRRSPWPVCTTGTATAGGSR